MNEKLLSHFKSDTVSVEKRIETGKALRKEKPLFTLGEYNPAANRLDPIAILEEQNKTRLQELVPVRYARMLTSSFAFLRGSAAVMASDITRGDHSGIFVQMCGDLHVANFGLFASAERKLIFGINDFDETLPGPWEWDLKRFVASIVVAGRFLGADDKLCREAVCAAVDSYRSHLKKYSRMGNIELWYTTITKKNILKTLTPFQRSAMKKIASKARRKTHLHVLGKITDIVDDKQCFLENAPFIVREKFTKSGRPMDEALALFLDSYMQSISDDRKALLSQYRIVDVVRKVVGVGSVGTRCWVIFLTGKSNSDPLFLQIKEAQSSVFEPFLSTNSYSNHGQRVISGLRLIHAAPDIFLGWGEQDGIPFYVRQLSDMKGGFEMNPDRVNLKHFTEFCRLCAWALALAHAKSGDAALLSGYIGKSNDLEEAMLNFAFSYAVQNEKDYQALVAAAKSGRITVAEKHA